MKNNILSRLPANTVALLRILGGLADKHNINAYVVGGFVRDIILKRPNLDIDIVLESDAVKFAKNIIEGQKGQGFFVRNVYPRFGTATLSTSEGVQIDLAGARKENYPYPGALPRVSFGTIHDDLFRRDFSINALAVSINRKKWGEVVDDFGGEIDIQKKRIRVLHDLSFMDDPTRILRAVRFEQRFGFKIEPHSLRLLKEALGRHAVDSVKAPRYFEEFKKSLKELPHPGKHLLRLGKLRAVDFLGAVDRPMAQILKVMERINRSLFWFDENFPKRGPINRWLTFFLPLTADRPLSAVKALVDRFQLSRQEQKIIFSFWQVWHTINKISFLEFGPRGIYRFFRPVNYEGLVVLKAIGSKACQSAVETFLEKYDQVRLLINGDDLKAMGISPGKRMGRILSELLFEKLDGKLHSYRDELNSAKVLSAN